MDKVTKFLEGYVEWLAVALGAGFLGWMLYGYVLNKPVSVAVGPNPAVSPSDVDPLIFNGPATAIKQMMDNHATPPSMGPSPDLADNVSNAFVAIAPSVKLDTNTPYTPLPVPLDQGPGENILPKVASSKVKELPTAPALVDLVYSKGHSNTPAANPAVNNGAAPAPAPGKDAVQAVDRNWLTIEGTLHMADLAASFKSVGIDPTSTFSHTCILRVYLFRQERTQDGSWGEETQIAPLDINPLIPLPAVNAPFAEQKDYIENYAEKNVPLICLPPFYTVLQGDKWYEPGTPNPNQADLVGQNTDFDPNNPLAYTGDPNELLPEELVVYAKAKAAKEAADALKSRTSTPHPSTPTPPANQTPPDGGGSSSGRGRGRGEAADPQRPPNDHNLLMPPRMERPPAEPPMPTGGNPAVQNSTIPPAITLLPIGSFNPATQADFKMWAHDPTVQAGKTYRYTLRYVISNPVARTTGLCANPALEKQFSIESSRDHEVWTDPISVEADTNFFAYEYKRGVQFRVFKWKNGVWQMQNAQVNPGDMVGSAATDGAGNTTDFTTGWTLVDVRQDAAAGPNSETLVLVSDNGTVLIKEMAKDAHSPQHRRLYHLANPGQGNTAQAAVIGKPVPPPGP
jgi:hypothetical protein